MRLDAQLEALLFLAPEPVTVEELADALQTSEEAVTQRGAKELEADLEGRGLVLRAGRRRPRARLAPGRRGGRAAPARPPAHAGAHARPGRDAGDRRLPAAGLPARGGPHPRRGLGVRDHRAGRPRADRGGRALAVRRRALPHDAAVPQALRPRLARGAAGRRAVGPEPRGGRRRCASACCAPARPAARPPPREQRGERRRCGEVRAATMRNFSGLAVCSSVRKLTLALGATTAIGGATTFGLAQAQQQPRDLLGLPDAGHADGARQDHDLLPRRRPGRARHGHRARVRAAATTPARSSRTPTARARASSRTRRSRRTSASRSPPTATSSTRPAATSRSTIGDETTRTLRPVESPDVGRGTVQSFAHAPRPRPAVGDGHHGQARPRARASSSSRPRRAAARTAR